MDDPRLPVAPPPLSWAEKMAKSVREGKVRRYAAMARKAARRKRIPLKPKQKLKSRVLRARARRAAIEHQLL